MSAAPARRCSTGRWPSSPAARFVLRIEDTDAARNRPEWTEGIISALAWIGINGDNPVFEGPYFQSAYEPQHREAVGQAARGRQRLLLRLHPRAGEGPHRLRAQGLRRLLPRPGPDRGRGPFPHPRRGRHRGRGPDPRHESSSPTTRRRTSSSRAATAPRCSCWPTRWTTSRCGSRHVVRGEEHLSNTPKQQLLWPALGRAPARLGARAGHRQREAPEAVQAPRQGRPGVLPRGGLPGRGDGQLPDAARLGPRRRPGDHAVVGDGAAVRAGGRQPLAGLLRREEAPRVQRRIHPGAARSRRFIAHCEPWLEPELGPRDLRQGRRARPDPHRGSLRDHRERRLPLPGRARLRPGVMGQG